MFIISRKRIESLSDRTRVLFLYCVAELSTSSEISLLMRFSRFFNSSLVRTELIDFSNFKKAD
ncbi:hypothetical protein NUACC21_64390 [Scytonema sp. NUACC21]